MPELTPRKLLLSILAMALLLFALLSAVVYSITYHPAAMQEEVVTNQADAPLLQPGQSIRVMTWNVQFFAGNSDNDFFFDSGADSWPARQHLDQVAAKVAAIIRQENPDIILLQELDDGATRTYEQDQLQQLLSLLPADYKAHASTYYWKADYVPHPDVNGAAGMKLSTVSRYRIDRAVRHALSPITDDNWLEQQFYPKRAVLQVDLPIAGGGTLQVLNAHLSAFAQGSNTMELQVQQVSDLMNGLQDTGQPVLIGGDFNLLPPGKALDRLSERDRSYYNPLGTEIAVLFRDFQVVPSLAESNSDSAERWYTHSPNRGDNLAPNKTIDYLFLGRGLRLGSHYVRQEATLTISDHMPVMAMIELEAESPISANGGSRHIADTH